VLSLLLSSSSKLLSTEIRRFRTSTDEQLAPEHWSTVRSVVRKPLSVPRPNCTASTRVENRLNHMDYRLDQLASGEVMG
jgi:hypothetical protein